MRPRRNRPSNPSRRRKNRRPGPRNPAKRHKTQTPGVGRPCLRRAINTTRTKSRALKKKKKVRAFSSGSWLWGILGVLFVWGIVALVDMVFDQSDSAPTHLSFRDKIGLVRIEGEIAQSEEKEFWMDSMHKLAENDRVRGIVIRIDSPGGAVGASQELQAMVHSLREDYGKTVFVSMGDVAASGGYYIASAADRIFALKGTLTGSIGVIFSKPQIGELAKKIGYETEVIKTGRFKGAGALTRPMTEAEREMFQILIDDAFEQFQEDVLEYRTEKLKLAADKFTPQRWADYLFEVPQPLTAQTFLAQIADGRAYSGRQGIELGLVDEIGTLDDTIDALSKMLGIDNPDIIEPQPRRTLSEILSARLSLPLPAGHARLQYLMTQP